MGAIGASGAAGADFEEPASIPAFLKALIGSFSILVLDSYVLVRRVDCAGAFWKALGVITSLVFGTLPSMVLESITPW